MYSQSAKCSRPPLAVLAKPRTTLRATKRTQPAAVQAVCLFCAPGRIRTSVAARAIGLQPIAIDHSATDAWAHYSRYAPSYQSTRLIYGKRSVRYKADPMCGLTLA